MASFTAQMSDFCRKEAPEKIGASVRGIVIEIANRLIQRSPVGDPSYWISPPPPGYSGGRFRGNWQYSFASPARGDVERIDKSGSETMSAIRSEVGLSKVAGVHWISNNLPYAERIESGWSTNQAPQGVVALTELEFPQIVRAITG